MKGLCKLAFLGTAVACVMAAAPVWAELKIGYVNYSQLMEESPQAKAISEQIRNEFMPRQRELQNQQQSLKSREERLQKDGATMTDEQRGREEKELRDGYRDFQRKQTEAQDDFNARRNEELSRLQQMLINEVRIYAKAQSFDLVLAEGVIYANNALDITAQILSQLQAHAGSKAGAAAPSSSGSAAPKPAKPPASH